MKLKIHVDHFQCGHRPDDLSISIIAAYPKPDEDACGVTRETHRAGTLFLTVGQWQLFSTALAIGQAEMQGSLVVEVVGEKEAFAAVESEKLRREREKE